MPLNSGGGIGEENDRLRDTPLHTVNDSGRRACSAFLFQILENCNRERISRLDAHPQRRWRRAVVRTFSKLNIEEVLFPTYEPDKFRQFCACEKHCV